MNTFSLSDKPEQKYKKRIQDNINFLKTGKGTYIDPDIRIVDSIEIKGETFQMSPDGICGIKFLQDNCDKANLAEAYATIRKKLFLWPKHKQNINQRRYSCFRDRIDFTIFDIREFYKKDSIESRLVKENSPSAKYLRLIGSFKNFIEEYELQNFVDEKENVKNLSAGGTIERYSDYEYSKDVNTKYLTKLIELL